MAILIQRLALRHVYLFYKPTNSELFYSFLTSWHCNSRNGLEISIEIVSW